MSDFAGRALIVTGGARGIGAETARRFARCGGQVLVCDILEAEGTALCAEIGEAAAFMRIDVTDPEQCQSAADEALSRFGRVDCLVNAAVRILPGRLEALSPNDWKAALDVGLTGSFLMAQAVGRVLIAAGHGGAIVNLSSVGGRQPYGMTGAYSTVKAAVIMLSRHLAIEWAEHGIRVNCVCPGHTETPLTAYMRDPEVKRARAAVTPLGRVGQPEDVAEGILYLLSDAASYVTAATLDIDGGLSASLMNHMPGRKWD